MGDTQPTIAQQFAERLAWAHRQKQARDDRYITQEDVADALQTHPSNVSNWFSGKQMPGHENMRALAEYFDVTPSWLHYGGPETPPMLRPHNPGQQNDAEKSGS